MAGHVSQNWNTLCLSLINLANQLTKLDLEHYEGEMQYVETSEPNNV